MIVKISNSLEIDVESNKVMLFGMGKITYNQAHNHLILLEI